MDPHCNDSVLLTRHQGIMALWQQEAEEPGGLIVEIMGGGWRFRV